MIGNDIIDLKEVSHHPRAFEKICVKEELKYLSSSDDFLWVLWAVKEATFKLMKKSEPTLFFQPKQFVYNPLLSICRFKNYTAKIQIIENPNYIHAVALWSQNKNPLIRISSKGAVAESQAVRQLAIDMLNDIGYDECVIKEVPPKIFRKEKLCDQFDLSLSHDGRYLAASILMI